MAEFARRNGDFVCGIVLVDALQGPGAHVTGDPQSPLAPDIVRTVNMLEDGLAFSYCGRGRGAVPPVRWRWRACRGHSTPLHLATAHVCTQMSRGPANMPTAFKNPTRT